MKNTVDIFIELGNRLENFGQDAHSRSIIAAACRENTWFRADEVVQAIDAIRTEYLDRDKLTRWLSRYSLPVEDTGSVESIAEDTHRNAPAAAAPFSAEVPDPIATRSTAKTLSATRSEASRHTVPAACSGHSVLVIAAGNIPLVGFFDLLCVVVSGCRCLVKPSVKDTVLMRYIVDLLKDIEQSIPLEIYDGTQSFDAVIATGSDNANRYFRAEYATVPTLLRGNRHSVAVLSGHETPTQMAALADDIFTCSGLGCRNVSLIFAPEGAAVTFAPREMNPKYRAGYRQRKALRTVCRQPYTDLGHALLVESEELPQALAEIALVRYNDVQQVVDWLKHHQKEIQCVVADHSELLGHPRRVPIGTSQRPTLLDYPDQADVMAWLSVDVIASLRPAEVRS